MAKNDPGSEHPKIERQSQYFQFTFFLIFKEQYLMCGFAGIVFFDAQRPVEKSTLKRMAQTLRHRGPDDEGFHCDGNFGFGHQRLSIIDLSPAGHQPMCNEDKTVWIVHNGEIYNYLELRQELLKQGHTFRSNSDTEVILHLYEEKGIDCVSDLNGMFAFALWDSRQRRLFAARDRFGIKPFYCSQGKEAFIFASEIKALFSSKLVSPNYNPEGLADYITFQLCLGDKTMFKNIYKILPGESICVKSDGQIISQKYWDLNFPIDTSLPEKHFQDRLLELLQESVRWQLRADVPIGSHLSGGLDSSTVACFAASMIKPPLRTFCGAFKESNQYDETNYARTVSQYIKSEHYEIFPTLQDFISVLPQLIYFMDEPAAGPGLFPQYFVSELASQKVKVVLGGQGGDEIFGGYTRYLIAYLERCLKGAIEGSQEEKKYVVTFESIFPNLRQLQGYEPLLRYFFADGMLEGEDSRYFRLIDRSHGIKNLINPDFLPRSHEYDPYQIYREIFNSAPCQSLINKMTWFDIKVLLPALLQVEDRTSMAVSLESRVPLLDHRIAELMASIPPMIKYKGGQSKHIFRQTVRDLLPPEIYNRTDKMGFPVPLQEWYAQKPMQEFLRRTLLDPAARGRGLFKNTQIEERLNYEQPYGRGIWGLLCLEQWFKNFSKLNPSSA